MSLRWFVYLSALLLAPNTGAVLIDSLEPPAKLTTVGARQFADGLTALSAKDLDGAARAFAAAATSDPKAPEPQLGLAEIALLQGKPDKARELLERALTANPGESKVRHAIARLRIAERDFVGAEEDFRKLITEQPQNALLQLDLADLYATSMQRPAAAADAYRAAIAIAPKHAGAHHGLGVSLGQVGKVDEAVAALEKAAALAPDNPLPVQALGKLYQHQNHSAKALSAYDRALASQPDFVPALIGKGDIYLGERNFDAALAEYDKAVSVAPEFDEVLLKRAMTLQALERTTEARAAYLAALGRNPKLGIAYNNLAWLASIEKKDLDKAESWARKAVDLAPQVAAFQDTLGWVLHLRGKTTDAHRVLTKAAAMEPRSTDTYVRLGQICEALGKVDEARVAYTAALALDAAHDDARQRLDSLRR